MQKAHFTLWLAPFQTICNIINAMKSTKDTLERYTNWKNECVLSSIVTGRFLCSNYSRLFCYMPKDYLYRYFQWASSDQPIIHLQGECRYSKWTITYISSLKYSCTLFLSPPLIGKWSLDYRQSFMYLSCMFQYYFQLLIKFFLLLVSYESFRIFLLNLTILFRFVWQSQLRIYIESGFEVSACLNKRMVAKYLQ